MNTRCPVVPNRRSVARTKKNQRPRNRPSGLFMPKARSSITNGSSLLPNVDGRSLWVRRFRDLLTLHLNDLGGDGVASEAEKALVRRAACLIVELERMEM